MEFDKQTGIFRLTTDEQVFTGAPEIVALDDINHLLSTVLRAQNLANDADTSAVPQLGLRQELLAKREKANRLAGEMLHVLEPLVVQEVLGEAEALLNET